MVRATYINQCFIMSRTLTFTLVTSHCSIVNTAHTLIVILLYDKTICACLLLCTSIDIIVLASSDTCFSCFRRYYDQFVAVETKLPFTEDQVRVNFQWYDAFEKGTLLSGRPKLNIAQGSFEKACLLFNIAAIQSQVASVQSKETDEGLKLSAKLFQVTSCLSSRYLLLYSYSHCIYHSYWHRHKCHDICLYVPEAEWY